MEEKVLVSQLKALKRIKPSQNWAVLTKERIIGKESEEMRRGSLIPSFNLPSFVPLRPAFAFSALTLLAVVAGLTVWSLGSLPGDMLYPAKKTVRQINLFTEDPVSLNLKMAAESARALKEIAENNETAKLSPAIKEYEESVKRAAASLDGPVKDGNQVLKIAEQVNQIEQTAKEIEELLQTELAKQEREEILKKTLAMVSEEVEELTGGYEAQIARQLEDLAEVSLNEEQQGLFETAIKEFENGEYELAQNAINHILELFNQNE